MKLASVDLWTLDRSFGTNKGRRWDLHFGRNSAEIPLKYGTMLPFNGNAYSWHIIEQFLKPIGLLAAGVSRRELLGVMAFFTFWESFQLMGSDLQWQWHTKALKTVVLFEARNN
jgi:hypothetical protein